MGTTPADTGISVLHKGAEPPVVDLVAIHGLNSTPTRCWQKEGVNWLAEFLPETIPNARISTFGYNSAVLEDASRARIRDHASSLLQDVTDQRSKDGVSTRKTFRHQADNLTEVQDFQRPIVFICHSLGGILVKQALVMANTNPRFAWVKAATTGIIFMGCPHRGSDTVSLGHTIAKIAKVVFFQKPKTQLLDALKKDCEQLQDLSEEFAHMHSQFKIVSCYELKETSFKRGILRGSTMVVQEHSAKLAIEKEILVAMDTDHHEICKFNLASDPGYVRVSNRVKELVDEAPDVICKKLNEANQLVLLHQQTPALDKDDQKWLAPNTDYSMDFRTSVRSKLLETCHWILDRPEFVAWQTPGPTTNKHLWIHGKPGCGKTILASFIIQCLQLSKGQPIIYFFCSGQPARESHPGKRQQSTILLRTLIYQLVQLNPRLAVKVKTLRQQLEKSQPTLDEQWELFSVMVQSFDGLICVIDGLDECEEKELGLIMPLLSEISRVCPATKMLVMSRNISTISSSLSQAEADYKELAITSADVSSDLQMFIRHQLQSSRKLQKHGPALVERISEALFSKADGMFIYVKFMLSNLEAQPNVRGVETMLESLPKDLFALYKRTFERLEMSNSTPFQRQLAALIFNFAIFGFRQLHIAELSQASQVEPGKNCLQTDLDFNSLGDGREEIERLCAPFLEIVDDQVKLVHHSARQFLAKMSTTDTFLTPMSEANPTILRCCVQYLSLDVFREPLGKARFEPATKDEIVVANPFIDYAARYWSSHLRTTTEPSHIVSNATSEVLRFVRSNNCLTWIEAVVLLTSDVELLETFSDDIEYWIQARSRDDSEVHAITDWLLDFRSSSFDWSAALRAEPGEIHYIDHFIPLAYSDPNLKQQRITLPEERKRKIFARESSLSYSNFFRKGNLIVLWNVEIIAPIGGVEERQKTIAAVFSWHTGKHILSISCHLPSTPPRHSVFGRTVMITPDCNYIIAVLHRELGVDDDVPDNEPYEITTYVWSLESQSSEPIWSTVSKPMICFDYSRLTVSFPDDERLCCPSGIFELASGQRLGDLESIIGEGPCRSLQLRNSMAAVIRSEKDLEIWKLTKNKYQRVASYSLTEAIEPGMDVASFFWVIREFSSTANLIVLWSNYIPMLVFNLDKRSFERISAHPTAQYIGELKACLSVDETKLAILAMEIDDLNLHSLSCLDLETKESTLIRTYTGTKPPSDLSFDPFSNNFIISCHEQRGTPSWLSPVDILDIGEAAQSGGKEFSSNDRMRYSFFFSEENILQVSKVPEPSQPLLLFKNDEFIVPAVGKTIDRGHEAEWWQQNVIHQEWSVRTATVKTTENRSLATEEALTALFWRKFPVVFDRFRSTSQDTIIRLAGKSIHQWNHELQPALTKTKSRDWDITTLQKHLMFLAQHFDPPIEQHDLSVHIVSLQLSAAKNVVAFLGGFEKVTDGYEPIAYHGQFIVIFTLETDPKMVWNWVAPKDNFGFNNRLDCLALCPSEGATTIAFSTVNGFADSAGVYIADYSSQLLQPRQLSGIPASQLLFNNSGTFLFAITSRPLSYTSTNIYALTVYSVHASTIVLKLGGISLFCAAAATNPSWTLASGIEEGVIEISEPCDGYTSNSTHEGAEILRLVHACANDNPDDGDEDDGDAHSQAYEMIILPFQRNSLVRTLGSLPRCSSSFTGSTYIFHNSSSDRDQHDYTRDQSKNLEFQGRINVAFGFCNAPPLLMSYPLENAGGWSGLELEDLPEEFKEKGGISEECVDRAMSGGSSGITDKRLAVLGDKAKEAFTQLIKKIGGDDSCS